VCTEGFRAHVLRGHERFVSGIEVGAPVNVVLDDREEPLAEERLVFGLRSEKERFYRQRGRAGVPIRFAVSGRLFVIGARSN
jgi:hypothetical protein